MTVSKLSPPRPWITMLLITKYIFIHRIWQVLLGMVDHGKEVSFRSQVNIGSLQDNNANKNFWMIRSKRVNLGKWQWVPSKKKQNLKIVTEQIRGLNVLRLINLETYLIWEKFTSLFFASFLFWKKKRPIRSKWLNTMFCILCVSTRCFFPGPLVHRAHQILFTNTKA